MSPRIVHTNRMWVPVLVLLFNLAFAVIIVAPVWGSGLYSMQALPEKMPDVEAAVAPAPSSTRLTEEHKVYVPIVHWELAPAEGTRLWVTPGDGWAALHWTITHDRPISSFVVYSSAISAQGPHDVVTEVASSTRAYTVTGLANGEPVYFALTEVDRAGRARIVDRVRVIPGEQIGFGEGRLHYFVRYDVDDKPVMYTLNRLTTSDWYGRYQQFAPDLFYDGVPLSAKIHERGLSGLVLLSFRSGGQVYMPAFGSQVMTQTQDQVVLQYTTQDDYYQYPAGSVMVTMTFEASRPFLMLTGLVSSVVPLSEDLTPCTHFSWNVFSAIGGAYNPNSRVVVPYDEDQYYVINGQALGIHYFARTHFWGLRMGAEGTPYARITTGFWGANSMGARVENGWPMAHDYHVGLLDEAPYDLDQVYDNLYTNYQEDEAGLGYEYGYSWQNADTLDRCRFTERPAAYQTTIYYWIGADDWNGAYGLNDSSVYQFKIAGYQQQLESGSPAAAIRKQPGGKSPP